MPRRIRAGALRGLTLDVDLTSNLQGYLGLAERELAVPLRQLVHGVRTCIDVGAADGWYTTYFLAAAPDARVIAIEPDVPHVAMVWENARRNAAGAAHRLTVVPKCIGTGRDGFKDGVLPLDAFLPVEQPCLVKIDIEGAELSALHSAPGIRALADVRWIIETHSAQLEHDCEQLLRADGYVTRVVRNAWWRALVPETRLLEHNRWLIATRPSRG